MAIIVHRGRVESVAKQRHDGSEREQNDIGTVFSEGGDHVNVEAKNAPLLVTPDAFNSFSEGESTYKADADFGQASSINSAKIMLSDGWAPNFHPPAGVNVKVGADETFFHESMSGGPDAAWQTHYPALSAGSSGQSGTRVGPWYRTRAGGWGQGFGGVVHNQVNLNNPFFKRKMRNDLPADFFDFSVVQQDDFGRNKFPNLFSSRRLLGWKERAVNASLTCPDPGCTGSAQIHMFDPYTERAQRCVFSFFVRPTDFDQTYSGEEVSWIKVNNVTVKANCQPQVSGCTGNPVSKELHACVAQVPLDKIMTQTGLLEISAKIPEVVDECPYEGNLLSAVPMATCMVAPLDPSPALIGRNQAMLTVTGNQSHMTITAPFKCKERGCKAFYNFKHLNLGDQEQYTNCAMRVTVNQTDFDSSFAPELIEYVAVQGTNVSQSVSPGKNPCQAVLAGEPLSDTEMEYVVVDGVDVTEAVRSGSFTVDGKISDTVDECASQGYLLDGMITIDCSI
jgi:hypothetical protein